MMASRTLSLSSKRLQQLMEDEVGSYIESGYSADHIYGMLLNNSKMSSSARTQVTMDSTMAKKLLATISNSKDIAEDQGNKGYVSWLRSLEKKVREVIPSS